MSVTVHTSRSRVAAGFTLLEMIVVLAVLGILLAAGMPLASAIVMADRRQEVQRELAQIAEALDAYWYANAAFPTRLTDTGFLGVYLQPGVGNTAVIDPFGAGAGYVYAVNNTARTATVYSRGENGVDNGAAREEFVQVVYANVPAAKKTQQRLRLIVELLANHIESGGAVTGNWAALRAQLGLGTEYQRDGWGTQLRWTAATHSLTSAGPDRRFGTADDITL